MKKKGTNTLNPNLKKILAKKQRKQLTAAEYTTAILKGDRVALGEAITIIESNSVKDVELANQIIGHCLPHANRSIRIGVTGMPGVGKSTFIEHVGQHLLQQSKKIAVLTIDPSSQVSGGSILGDKTRMSTLSNNPNVFIRPSPSGDSLGGVARKTREAMILCEAAGYDTILIETVGVGQAEYVVHSMVDCFLLLLLPGAGDELQGIKRGIVEMADVIIINKADGEREKLAEQTKKDYQNAAHLFPPKKSNWIQKVMTCSALDQSEITTTWSQIDSYIRHIKANHHFSENRTEQTKYWLNAAIKQGLHDAFFKNETVQAEWKKIEKAVIEKRLSPFQGANELLSFFKNLGKTK